MYNDGWAKAASNILVLLVTLLGGFIIANNSMAQLQGKYWYWECREIGEHTTGGSQQYSEYIVKDAVRIKQTPYVFFTGYSYSSGVYSFVGFYDFVARQVVYLDNVIKVPVLKHERLVLNNVEYYKANVNSYSFWISGRIDTFDADTFSHPYLLWQQYTISSTSIINTTCQGYFFFNKNQLPALFTDIKLFNNNIYALGYVSQQGIFVKRPWVGRIVDMTGSSGTFSLLYRFLELAQGASMNKFVRWLFIQPISSKTILLVGHINHKHQNGNLTHGGIILAIIDTGLTIVIDAKAIYVYSDTTNSRLWPWTRVTNIMWDSVTNRLFVVGYVSTSLRVPGRRCKLDLGDVAHGVIIKVPVCNTYIGDPEWVKGVSIPVDRGYDVFTRATSIIKEPGYNNIIVVGDYIHDCLASGSSMLFLGGHGSLELDILDILSIDGELLLNRIQQEDF
ncbi:MAG: hypothetical protein GXO48_03670 [Chlorobi bacterium]|nr:hypothetical protein [Chlorobiota bacterium]